MTYAHTALKGPFDAELDEWDQQRARIEDERRELKRCDTSVDFRDSSHGGQNLYQLPAG
jgi:hypothetical protein